ncbi:MAG: D-alanyl-D-alanine carboxypeptidase [Clostridia bacterium]|nr:D-alanyl-D-alanine carboxypeptidase [Clostridia bacterium]
MVVLLIKIILSLFLAVCSIFLSIDASALDVSAKSAALIETSSKEILYGKNENDKLPMASTTKIMTSLLTLESGIKNDAIIVNEDMLKVEGTSMGLLPGDSVALKDLVYGMLLASGNDAANVAAITVGGGDLEKFALLMNERAQQIGMKNTNFVTPSGLDEEGHYSTAYDMAILGATAISNPEFRSICSSKSVRISYGNPPYLRTLTNHNRLLNTYDSAIGIKTGFTKKSGRCLVSAAEKDGVTLVAVTLNAPNDWADHIKMFDYGFSQYKSVDLDSDLSNVFLNVVGAKDCKVALQCASQPQVTLKIAQSEQVVRIIELSHFEYAPINQGKIVGKASYYIEDELVCETPIITAQAVDSNIKILENKQPIKKEKKSFIKNFFEKFKK